jgi:hypothetical protein
MKYSTFQAINVASVVTVAVAILLFFPLLYVQLVPGLVILWGEIAVGILANRVAFILTKRGVTLIGVKGEQNPVMRNMLTSGDFTKLYLVYATMLGAGGFITALSVRLGAMLLGTLVLMAAFPLILTLDMLNDFVVVSRLEKEAGAAKGNQ